MNTSFLPYFKSSFSHGGMLGKVDLERIFSMLKNITGENGIDVKSDFGRGIKISGSGAGDSPKKWAFGVTVSGKVFTIQPGHVTVVNRSVLAVNGGDESTPTTYTYEDASEYAWVTVDITYDLMTPAIGVYSAYPTPTASGLKYPLARYRSDDGGVTYVADGDAYILHRGDIVLMETIVWGST